MKGLCLWAIAMTGAALGFQAGSQPDRENDVYQIYSLLLGKVRTSHGADNNPRYLIAARTRNPNSNDPCVRPPAGRETELREVLQDFKSSKAPRTLERRLSIGKPYQLLNDEEVKAFQQERNWPKPDSKAPDARFEGVTDVFILSDVYFSRNGKLALTSVASWCGGLCGQHEWKVLEKGSDGKWRELPWITCFTIARAETPATPLPFRARKRR